MVMIIDDHQTENLKKVIKKMQKEKKVLILENYIEWAFVLHIFNTFILSFILRSCVFERNMAENSDTLLQLAQLGYSMIAPIVLTGYTLSQCGGKKKKGGAASAGGADKKEEKSGGGASQKSEKKDDDKPAGGTEKPGEAGPKAPTDKNAVAGTHDPNYQTLANVDGNVFQEKGGAAGGAAPAAGGAAPAAGAPKPGGPGMAATHDPNYQTLAGIGNDCFDKKDGGAKPAAGGAAPAAPKPGGPGMAATHDPNYQTLAGIGNDCFQKK
ncbi:hypothetical protein B9Z55_001397 [Caenorhabditis nigoni]|uniref:Uncharacterized protein n=3 Tax=Caenorhabditis nigoni TaxID=1611254 RepID=A0A2G5VFM9_9PELO|nr:hypothetical protein B9Z55_001397 [Caenorhabditis nigoni]